VIVTLPDGYPFIGLCDERVEGKIRWLRVQIPTSSVTLEGWIDKALLNLDAYPAPYPAP
jgi:hypothetical protein